jgi:GMP reductase
MSGKHYLSYQEVFLIPERSDYHSRDDVETSVDYGPRRFKLPIVPANMECVIDTNVAKWLSQNDYFYIMHRFNKDKTLPPNTDNWKFVETANKEKWKTISISIGVNQADVDFLLRCKLAGMRIDYLTIDIAHAHSIRMKEMLAYVKESSYTNQLHGLPIPFVIAGNVATPQAVKDLEDWGADSVKVGIAQGGACTTYGMTGFGIPMFSCMLECAEVAKNPLIADGGIKTNGDFAKAVRAGGTMVMAGSVFAACKDAPGESIYDGLVDLSISEVKRLNAMDDYAKANKLPVVKLDLPERKILSKVYYGSASEYNKGSKRHVEGTKLELPCNGMTYEEKYHEIGDSYSSSVSYAGGDLNRVRWGVRTS